MQGAIQFAKGWLVWRGKEDSRGSGIDVWSDIEKNALTLRTQQAVPDVVVRGNELIVGNQRFILQLAPPPEPLPVSA